MKIMNVYFGIESYWKMKILLGLTADLKKKRKMSKKMKLTKNYDPSKEIDKINEKAKGELIKIENEINRQYGSKPRPKMAFIQFQSMNGVKLF